MGETTANAKNHVHQPKIAVAIKSQDGDTLFFRVAREKKLQDLLKTYCQGKNLKYSDISFIHNGLRLRPSKTLLELGIEDGDEIDAMGHHGGGGNPTP